MGDERRRHLRISGPFEGSCDVVGARDVRIVDLSYGGCFIDVMTKARPGDKVNVELRVLGRQLKVRGEVVYVDRVQGFAVMFTDTNPETLQQLREIVDGLSGA
jgi:hypothetical protein